MTVTAHTLQRWRSNVADTYGTPSVVLVRGSGAIVWDAEGNEYLDLLAGIAVNALGHAHPAVIEAVTTQLATLGHTSNLVATLPAIELAERLLRLTGRSGRVFFANSGAEANEAAFKLSRLTGRPTIIAALGSFHGRTAAALSLTGQQAKRSAFEPLVPTVRFVPFGDERALAQAVDDSVAAVMLEPIQGEGGVVVPPPGYLAAAQRIAHSAGALFMVDEVQTGVGRTGTWFAHQHESLAPDAMALAKGLGGGLPIGALVAFGDAGQLWQPGMHGSTFGGNPTSCAAALAVLDTIETEGLLEHAQQMEAVIRRGLSGVPGVRGIRGQGLLLGILLTPAISASEVQAAALRRGLIINAIGSDVLRLAPPLVITEEQTRGAVEVLSEIISDHAASVTSAAATSASAQTHGASPAAVTEGDSP